MTRIERHARPRRVVRRRKLSVVPACLLVSCLLMSCTSTPDAALTAAEYRTAVQAICTDTATARAGLTEPTEPAAVAEFARAVAQQLDAEADLIRELRPPDELEEDHRALAQNTADQADRWASLATTPPTDTDAFATLTDEVAALSFGRDDLAAQMELAACERTP